MNSGRVVSHVAIVEKTEVQSMLSTENASLSRHHEAKNS
jgi:hypothetical protein